MFLLPRSRCWFVCLFVCFFFGGGGRFIHLDFVSVGNKAKKNLAKSQPCQLSLRLVNDTYVLLAVCCPYQTTLENGGRYDDCDMVCTGV